MVGNNYLLFNQRLNFSSSSTFLSQRSKEDKQAQTVSGGQIDPTLLTTRGQKPKPHDIRGTPPGHLPAYISRSLDIPPLRRPTRQRVLEARQSPVHPPCCSAKALQTRQTPVHPPCCGVRVLPLLSSSSPTFSTKPLAGATSVKVQASLGTVGFPAYHISPVCGRYFQTLVTALS